MSTGLSLPTGLLYYLDYKYTEPASAPKRSKRGRPSTMKRFKIKYLNTKGQVKTRNIKASSEEKAKSEIKDMAQHYYTITEDLDESETGFKKNGVHIATNPCKEISIPSGSPIITAVQGSGLSNQKQKWLDEYAAYHQAWDSASSSSGIFNIYGGGYDSQILPVAIRVFAQLAPHGEVKPQSSENEAEKE